VIVHPHHVHYFTGWWTRPIFFPVLLITPQAATLALPFASDDPAIVDARVTYVGSRNASIVDDQYAEALKALQPVLRGVTKAAADHVPGAFLSSGLDWVDLGPSICTIKRTKLPDEVNVLRKSIDGAAAAFAWMRKNFKAGMNELDVYSNTAAEAVRVVGEPIGEFGNDFTCGGGGGIARNRAAQAGELCVLDLGVMLRGYCSDLCRTFAVSEATETQVDAVNQCVKVLDYVNATARPGVSCRSLHEEAIKMLDGYKGFRFEHHLGHGIGIFPHESPRLNKAWDDVLQEGDVFACEPGLYGPELRSGVRVEDNFVVTRSGVERLSNIPRGLARD
jgi:Xaa-Pro aminopeptidase